jgi:rhomboid family GlyGly-CTERM serine protease
VKLLGALTALAVALTLLDGSHFELTRALPEPWRIVTCHFTHWTYEQLAWDALAFAGLGYACARNSLRAFHATLLASVFLIPFAVLAFAPEIVAYRGLSGVGSALFALLLVQSRKSPLAIACAIAFAAKIAFEAVTGGAVFAADMGSGVVSVPVAHIAGAIIGATIGCHRWWSGRLARIPYTRPACASLPESSERC